MGNRSGNAPGRSDAAKQANLAEPLDGLSNYLIAGNYGGARHLHVLLNRRSFCGFGPTEKKSKKFWSLQTV